MNRVFAVVVACVGVSFCASPRLWAGAAAIPAADAGYFLDWSQRGDLLWTGTMEDSVGNVYNVKVCPGYVPMAEMAGRHWGRAGKALGEYGQKGTYTDLCRTSKEVVCWSSRDCLWRWGIKGAGKAWYNHFRGAQQIVNRRAFGWIFAYPMALCTATVESSFRVVTGVPVGLCGNAIGVVAVPAVGVTWPTLKGVAEVAVPGTAMPVAGTAWNTLGTPLLALAGQRPAPSRIDGFFVIMTPKAAPPPTPEEMAGLVRAAAELKPVVDDIAKRRDQARTAGLAKIDALQKEREVQYKAIRQAMESEDRKLQCEREARIRVLLNAQPQLQAPLLRLFKQGKLNSASLFSGESAVSLHGTGLTHEDLERVCHILAAPAAETPLQRDAAGRPEPFWLHADAPAGGVHATGAQD